AGSKPLSISSGILGVIMTISGLLDSRPRSRAGEEHWIGETFVCHVELHPCSERLGMGFVGHISIGYKAEDALLFFGFELLRGNLLLGITHSNCPLHSQNAKFDVGESFVLPGLDCNGRAPLCKSLGSDRNLIDNSWRDIGECKGSVLLRYRGETIANWPSKDDGGIGNRIVAGIDHRA